MVHVLLLNHDRYVLHDPGTNCSSDDGVLTLLSRLRKKGDLAEDVHGLAATLEDENSRPLFSEQRG
jgi:hypothetical protein